MKKVLFIVPLSMLIVIIIVVILFAFKKINTAYCEYVRTTDLLIEQAISFAEEYLEEKYGEDMTYVGHTCIYDKMTWTVTFSPDSDSERTISVRLTESKDTSLPISERFRVDSEW